MRGRRRAAGPNLCPVPDTPASVRLISDIERADAVRVIGHGMLADLTEETTAAWSSRIEPQRTHAAIDAKDQIVGVARWFPTDLSTPGGTVSAGAVTAVAVLPTHRRQGHLRRMMDATLAHTAEEGRAVSILVAAEWPIYGRFGYGPATEACAWEVDTSVPTTVAPSGEVELVDATGVRTHLEVVHDAMAPRRPGVITREARLWDILTGVEAFPGAHTRPGLERAALWRDDEGSVRGAVRYRVEERWERNRPKGTATVTELFAADHEAERQLWRHLLSLDWISTVRAEHRPVDDLIPFWLSDGRAAAQRDRFDHVWLRVLDVPAALRARVAGGTGEVVIEVVDQTGPAGGRWRVSGAPGGPLEVIPTDEEPGVRLPVHALGAAYLGGTPVARLAAAGWLDEDRPDAAQTLGRLLGWPTAPWTPTQF